MYIDLKIIKIRYFFGDQNKKLQKTLQGRFKFMNGKEN